MTQFWSTDSAPHHTILTQSPLQDPTQHQPTVTWKTAHLNAINAHLNAINAKTDPQHLCQENLSHLPHTATRNQTTQIQK